ncbi:tyrosine-type recombinase/integrase [Gorillibacterium sp. sgz500922]|uniref:tyrosine-type recombinase/integrase n=1 Tax=Gorillibacterium sp. sgz500922 TaxID=3446694 RepID=UPI003F66AF26
MAWNEYLGGNRYKIVERDPSKASRPKRSIVVEMPEDIVRSRVAKKKELWLAKEEEKWSEAVINGEYEDKGKNRSRSKKVTFADFISTWQKGYANEENMSGETLLNTMYIVDSRLLPTFGDSWISDISTLELVEWFADLRNLKNGQPLATNTKLNIYKVIVSIFKSAFEWGVIKSNPAEGLKRPSLHKSEKKKMRSVKQSYTETEVAELLLAMYDLPEHWRLYFTGVMLGGFRRGEFLAVEWTSLDYERSAVLIEKQITVDSKGNKIESDVKTVESEGWVPMPKWYTEQLRQYERQWKKEKLLCRDWRGGGKQYVFHGGNGVMYYPSTATNTWSKFLKKHQFPHVKLHGLRHTAGTLLREYGADQRSIQMFLRHSKLETTNRYTHESEAVNRTVIAQFENLNPQTKKFAP